MGNLLTRRREMTERKKSSHNLPSEYQEVQFLQSSGSQYILSGVVPDKQHSFGYTVDFEMTKTSSSKQTVIGTDTMDISVKSGKLFDSIQVGETRVEAGVYVGALGSGNSGSTYAKKRFYNGNLIDEYGTSSYWQGDRIPVFGAWVYAIQARSSVKLYSAQISYDEDVVRDFVPCYRKNDSKPGLYDILNNVFYVNSGSEEFTVGPNV